MVNAVVEIYRTSHKPGKNHPVWGGPGRQKEERSDLHSEVEGAILDIREYLCTTWRCDSG
jgi:hypothetical protein